ncbi:MAG TPA: LysR substrate-binding domain-containing protein [Candidatus Dormibacteraeota bacterium]|jgi:DNA-binding transcriptional LysR family regulator
MQDLNDLNLFVAVVTHGGFSAAARALDAPKSKLSRRIAGLEDHLGVRLLERSTRRFQVTDVGEDVLRHARAVMCEADAIDDIVLQSKAEPQGLVRVAAPPGVDRLISGSLPSLLAQYPKLRVQVIVSNRRVDLIEERVDVAVRMREVLDTDVDLQMKVISRSSGILVASPELLAAHGTPSSPAALSAGPTVSLSDTTGPDRWVLQSQAGEEVEVVHEPRLSSSSPSIVRQAVEDGVGVAVLPEWACRELLESGRLVRVLPDWARRQGVMHMVFTSRRGLLPGVRAVLDFLADALDPRAAVWEAAL